MGIKSGSKGIKIIGLFVVLILLGILGIITSVSAALEEDSEQIVEEEPVISSGSRALNTKISGYLQLWDSSYGGEPHSGVYGDGDGNNFYLGNKVYNFRIYLKNINDNGYIENVTTILKRGNGVGSVITIIDKYYNDSYITAGDINNFYYDFQIGNTATIQQYELIVDVEFVYVDDQNERYNRAGSITIRIQLASRLKSGGSGNILKLVAQDKNKYTVPLYSGTKNQLIALPNPYSASGTLENLRFTLSLSSSLDVETNVAEADTLYTNYGSNSNFEFLLNDAGSLYTPPGEVPGSCEVSYKYDDKVLTEKSVQVVIEIAETPIMCIDNQIAESDIGTTSGGKPVANFEIYQGTTSQKFSIKFRNDGNIDLKDVNGELFTDNAAFFFKSKFYYDENDYAYKRSYGKTIAIGDVSSGQSVTREFSTEVIKNLPPGIYKIPIRYTAKFNRGGMIDFDLDVNDYHETIMAARSVVNEGYTPFIVINVIEGDDANDKIEPDLQAICTSTLKPGMRNVLLPVEITNLENYRIINVKAQIRGGGTSPLQPLNEADRTALEIDSQEVEFTMYGANDPVFSNKFTVHFPVDVYIDAAPGMHDVPLTITCLNPFNQVRTNEITVPLNILPVPPSFVISDVSTTKIEPGKTFTLTVKVYNCGGCEAKVVNVMFNGSTNLFTPLDGTPIKGIQGPKTISKNDAGEFTFRIKANDVNPGATYQASVYISFEDMVGNSYGFNSNPEKSVTLQVKKEEKKDFELTTGIGLLILGVFVLVSVFIFGIIRARIAKKYQGREDAGDLGTDRVPPPPRQDKGVFGRRDRKETKVVDMRPRSQSQSPLPSQPPPRPQPPPRSPPPPQQTYSPAPPPQSSYPPEPQLQAQSPPIPPQQPPAPPGTYHQPTRPPYY